MTSGKVRGIQSICEMQPMELGKRLLYFLSIEMEAPFGQFGGTTVPRDYDTGNKKLTGNLNGKLVANVSLFEFYNF